MAVLENAWYYLALKAAIPMAAMSGSAGDTAAYRTRMNSIAAEFTSSFWNASGQYFISSSVTSPDDRANAMAVLSGLAQPQHYSGIRTVLTQRTYASPWMEKYVLEALCMIKSEDAALTRMKSRYAAMVNAGYTTLWEVWSGLKDGTINHGWNAPNTVLSQYIAGVAPTAAGWSSYGVLPQMANLTAISGVVPSIKGNITVSDSLSASQFVMSLVSPSGTKALVGIPKKRAWQSVTANGGTVWNQGAFLAGVSGVSGAGEDSLYIKFNVDPGAWRFVASLLPVGVSEQPEKELSNSYSVNMRKVADRVAFDPEFAGKTKTVKVYNLSGRLVCSKAVMNNIINLQKDFCLPVNVYVVEVKTVR
jgi:alpha-L-rhamnosidase